MVDFISAVGPASTLLPGDEIDGYRPVNRNGEVTQNAFVHGELFQKITNPEIVQKNKPPRVARMNEKDPLFHEWASVTPGLICVTEKDRHTSFRSHLTAETAVPVLACAQGLDETCNSSYQFAGIARSKSVRDYDDILHGPKRDEYFTLAIGGPFTILNNGNGPIKVGDMVEWTFYDNENTFDPSWTGMPAHKRQKAGPRRIQVRKATSSHARVFGRALQYARRGEPFDVLIGNPSM